MLNIMITIYRAWPFRPHCDSTAGRHVWLCSALGLNGDRGLCPNAHPGGESMSVKFNRGGTRCPAKDA